jgi:hypothetical protein
LSGSLVVSNENISEYLAVHFLRNGVIPLPDELHKMDMALLVSLVRVSIAGWSNINDICKQH